MNIVNFRFEILIIRCCDIYTSGEFSRSVFTAVYIAIILFILKIVIFKLVVLCCKKEILARREWRGVLYEECNL